MVSEETLHWRNPNEITYIFALIHHMSYKEAQELDKKVREELADTKESTNITENNFTPIIRTEILALNTTQELIEYLKSQNNKLGQYHNHAYHAFMEMLEALENPKELYPSEKKRLTIRNILKEYLFGDNVLYAKEKVREKERKMEIAKAMGHKNKNNTDVSAKDSFIFTTIQKNIIENWPDETTLSKMKTRKMDVTRKVLILLFLATDSGIELSDDELDKELTVSEVFEDLYQRLNHFLLLCGFSVLDPRSAFDWLILYCICVQDLFDMDIRMRGIFKEMFGEREDPDGE